MPELKSTLSRPLEEQPIAADPFRTVYIALLSLAREHLEVSNAHAPKYLPQVVEGQCGPLTHLAANLLHHCYEVPRANLFVRQLSEVRFALDHPTNDEHDFLYVKDAHLFSIQEGPCDIFFDSTCAQFHDTRPRERYYESSGLYGNLRRHGNESGRKIMQSLMCNGYVPIPLTSEGDAIRSLLISSYSPFSECDPPDLFEVSREVLFEIADDEDVDYCALQNMEAISEWVRLEYPGSQRFVADPLDYLEAPTYVQRFRDR